MTSRMARTVARVGAVVLAIGLATACDRPDAPDTQGVRDIVLHNGVVLTMDDSRPRAEAILVRADRIAAVGSNDEVRQIASRDATVIDLGGRTVVPGFIDAHSHRLGDFAKVGYPDAAAVVPDTLAQGWTSVHELYVDADRLANLQALDAAGKLPLRVDAYLPVNSFEVTPFDDWYSAYRPGQVMSPHVRIAGLKFFVDFDTGREIRWTQADLTAAIVEAHNKGWQVAAKAIGSATLEMILNAVEQAQGGRADPAWRHRIEHILAVTPAQMQRLRALGVVAIFQTNIPGQLAGDKDIEALVQREPAGAVAPWRSLAASGVIMAGGTGWPSYHVDEPSGPPFASPVRLLYQAVTRTGNHGAPPEPWMQGESITVEQALRAYTLGSAYASFTDGDRGSITEGKLADLVVLSQNPLAVAVEDILKTEVLITMIGGRAEWCATGAEQLCPPAGPASVTGAPVVAPTTGAGVVTVRPGEPLRIALLAPVSGKHAVLGPALRNAAVFAVEEVGPVRGFPVEITLIDDGCDTAKGEAAANDVVANGRYVAVLGPSCSASAFAGLPRLEEAGIPVVSGAATQPGLGTRGPTVFHRTVLDDDQLATKGGAAYVEDLGTVKTFFTRYTARYGALPAPVYRPFMAFGHDAALLLLRAIQGTASESEGVLAIDRAALIRQLGEMSGFEGVTGTIRFDPDGNRAP